MLGKVLGLDMKACAKMFLPMYLVAAALTGLAKLTMILFQHNDNTLVSLSIGLTMVLYGVTIFALVILPMVFMVIYFYRHFLTDQGYLTFTLPVKTSTLVVSQQINGIIWTILSVVVLCAALFGMFGNYIIDSWSDIKEMFRGIFFFVPQALADFFGNKVNGLTRILVISMLVVEVLFLYSSLYASMALGQLYTKHKILGSVIAYIGIRIAVSILNSVASFVLFYVNSVNVYLAYQVVEQIFLGVFCVGITIYILKNKLNLD